MNVWHQILEHLQPKVTAEGFDNWLRGTAFLGTEGDTLLVSAPDRETRSWLETEYAPVVRNAIQELGLRVRHVSYECAPAKLPPPSAPAPEGDWDLHTHLLNPKFTFDT